MSVKYFTVAEANDLIPKITPLLTELLARRARVTNAAHQSASLLHDVRSNIGSPALAEMTQDFVAIETLVQQIKSFGCLLKDTQSGLIDFLAVRDGRDVYLCWRLGEREITHYHELHTGFGGRQPI